MILQQQKFERKCFGSVYICDPGTQNQSLGYIYSNSQKYIVWVKIIHFSVGPKIIINIMILSKDHVP